MTAAILWYRRDLRLHDLPALEAALLAANNVVPVFVLDDRLLHGRHASPGRTWFMLGCLRALDAELRSRGSRLIVSHGPPEDVLRALCAQTGARDVFASRDFGPYARWRDRSVDSALSEVGARLLLLPGTLVQEPEAVLTDGERPYSVFTPFRRRWGQTPTRELMTAPMSLPPVDAELQGDLSVLPDLESDAPPLVDAPQPGEAAARERLRAWVESDEIDAYAERRDRMDVSGTSRISQDLRWGLLSPLEVIARAGTATEGRRKFVDEVVWREFYYHVLSHNPRVVREPFQRQYAVLRWDEDEGRLRAWEEGRTGYPVVDAAMRQLVATGWMHNRARMIVASFLTKDLLLDWRLGERFFMRHLLDGDLASNNGGWQWAASTGTDPQPYFRIFNPVLQGKRFDPEGSYVRRWVPELGGVPDRYIHAPWTMPVDAQEEVGCVIGRDYPAPIVDHSVMRERALALYAGAKTARS